MATLTTFIVLGSNPNKTGGHVWKLAVEIQAEAFGLKKTVKRTYYIGGMPKPATVNAKLKEDLAKFEIVERPFEVDGNTMNLKWLHVKVA